MKKKSKYLYVPILGLVLIIFYNFQFNAPYASDHRKDKMIACLQHILEYGHYKKTKIDDHFSQRVFNDYIEYFDPQKQYFLSTDIKKLKKYYNKIDDEIKEKKFSFFDDVNHIFKKRSKDVENIYTTILDKKFNYEKYDSIHLDVKKRVYPKNKSEQIASWEKHLKYSVIQKLTEYLKQEKKKAKEDKNYNPKSFDELEKKAKENTLENIKDFSYYQDKLDESDKLSIYLNSITTQFDPHTKYFAPRTKKRFESAMSGSFEGIGAIILDKRGHAKITKLVPGGPAYKQGDLEVGDLIVKVSQGEKGESKSIVGMKLEDAIELIKGKKGTTVILTVKKVNNTYKKIPIVRDIIEFEETFVKSTTFMKDKKKYGFIHLPKFYIDINEKTNRDCVSDMRKEIEELKKENIKGLIIDLRDNGGGSLSSVIDIAGFFVKKGPIVQIKQKNGKIDVKKSKNKDILWTGSLVVMINGFSASASEILSAAMQDYKRAIVIGSQQTYGKGTVQNIVPLNDFISSDKNLGAIKLTIQKFYRINGASTQIKGVKPDIILPDRFTYLKIFEKDLENALEWDEIEKVDFSTDDFYSNFSTVLSGMKKNIENNEQFMKMDNYAKWLKKIEDQLSYSLNLKSYQQNEIDNESQEKEYKDILKYDSPYVFKTPVYLRKSVSNDSILKSRRDNWYNKLDKDIYVNTAIDLLSQLKIKTNN